MRKIPCCGERQIIGSPRILMHKETIVLLRDQSVRLALNFAGLYSVDMDQEPDKADTLIGRHLDDGRYRLIKRLGAGGMGSVYVAHQATVDRNVAIKVIHPQLLVDPSLKLRFHREARVLASWT